MADSFYCEINQTLVNIDNTWLINQDIDTKKAFDCVVTNKLTLESIDLGEHIQLFDSSDNTLFDGFIKRVQKYDPWGNNTTVYYRIESICWKDLASRRLVADVVEDTTVEDIIRDVILPVLAEEGVTEGIITCSIPVERAKFAYITCFDALEQLKNLAYGWNWDISSDTKELNFYNIASNYIGFNIDSNIYIRNFSHDSHLNLYRNKQYTRGGKARTITQSNESPSPAPDGVSRNFTLKFPVAELPTIEINTGSGWVSQTVGVNGIDEYGTKQFYFTYNSQIINQDDSETILSATDQIRVTYIGLRDLFVSAEDPEQISSRAVIEGDEPHTGVSGASGIYEHIIEEPSLETTDQALDFSTGLIKKYGQIADSATFDAEDSRFLDCIGKLARINLSLYGINDNFLITQVTITQLSQTKLNFRITALDGALVGGWEQYFVEMLKRDRKFSINDSEVLLLLHTTVERSRWFANYLLTTYTNLLFVSESTLVSETTIIGGSVQGVTNLYD